MDVLDQDTADAAATQQCELCEHKGHGHKTCETDGCDCGGEEESL